MRLEIVVSSEHSEGSFLASLSFESGGADRQSHVQHQEPSQEEAPERAARAWPHFVVGLRAWPCCACSSQSSRRFRPDEDRAALDCHPRTARLHCGQRAVPRAAKLPSGSGGSGLRHLQRGRDRRVPGREAHPAADGREAEDGWERVHAAPAAVPRVPAVPAKEAVPDAPRPPLRRAAQPAGRAAPLGFRRGVRLP